MRKPSTRKITAPATSAKRAAKPAAAPATDTAVSAEPATVAAAAPTELPAVTLPVAADTSTTPAAAKPSSQITRTAATIVRNATNFASLSDRDTAYLAFYATLYKRCGYRPIGLIDITGSGERPAYAGSNKPHDAGVIVRLTKAGYLTPAADGRSFDFTDTAKTLAAYTTAQA